ncbi:MAG: hypothetical protein QXH24_06310 [Candidatus Bathyarchaeia archaeon]
MLDIKAIEVGFEHVYKHKGLKFFRIGGYAAGRNNGAGGGT